MLGHAYCLTLKMESLGFAESSTTLWEPQISRVSNFFSRRKQVETNIINQLLGAHMWKQQIKNFVSKYKERKEMAKGIL